ncbi:MAG: ABC transporter permease subunit [Xanthobacteraceae bacterium]|nr:ABC transporter permease subunit [Xanthobacteraceae bacterium]
MSVGVVGGPHHFKWRSYLWLVASTIVLTIVIAEISVSQVSLAVPGRGLIGEIAAATLDTLRRLLAGLFVGITAGSLLGTAMGAVPILDRLLSPPIHALRQVPLFGWIPLIGLWAGLGEPSKVTFVALAVAYVMVLSAHEAIRSISPRLTEVSRALGLDPLTKLRVLVIPSVTPALLAGVRIALAAGWSAVVGAEILMAAAPGLGALIWGAREVGRPEIVVAGSVVVGVLGALSNAGLRSFEQRVLHRYYR